MSLILISLAAVFVIVIVILLSIIKEKITKIEYWRQAYFDEIRVKDNIDGSEYKCCDSIEDGLPNLESITLQAFDYSRLNIVSIERNHNKGVTEVWYRKWSHDKGMKLDSFYFNIPTDQHDDLVLGWKRYVDSDDDPRYSIAVMGYEDVGHDTYDSEWIETGDFIEPGDPEFDDGPEEHVCKCSGGCE